MFKQYVSLEIEKGEHKFYFNMPIGASYGIAYDAAFSVLQELVKLAQEAAQKAKPKEIE